MSVLHTDPRVTKDLELYRQKCGEHAIPAGKHVVLPTKVRVVPGLPLQAGELARRRCLPFLPVLEYLQIDFHVYLRHYVMV